MARINDKTTYPTATPAAGDHVIGTDVSNTTNSPDGEVVTFNMSDIKDYALTGSFANIQGSSMSSHGGTGYEVVPYNSVISDADNIWDETTNYRCTPSIAGVYMVTILLRTDTAQIGDIAVYKNGAAFARVAVGSVAGQQSWHATALVPCNGTTDYFDIRMYAVASTAYQSVAANNQLLITGPLTRE